MFAGVPIVLRYNNANILFRSVHTSRMRLLKQDWRMENGLTENPNAFGPLTNLPDYSFKDGRPVPLGVGQKKRMIKQQQYAAKIVQLVGEIDYAVARHARLQEEEKQRRQNILDSKLKPKGDLLLKKEESTT
ncbi:hypothetical protein KPH14_006552 [Odynerus spinipes]|uniref:Large ribosomal subunit protein mL52 n=1 Tax=Odynerus spinipes TaxID=1348599 RepID=A0AAD9RQR3_9HYME|nr:hypothetical protein KPH14_006552 [Odynerus spinipes]